MTEAELSDCKPKVERIEMCSYDTFFSFKYLQ